MVGHKTIWKWVAAALALLLLFSLPGGCTARVKGIFKNILTPVQGFFLKGGRRLKAGTDSVRGFGGLAEENRLLKEAVVKLQADARLNRTIKEEYLKLRELLEPDGGQGEARQNKDIEEEYLKLRELLEPDNGQTEAQREKDIEKECLKLRELFAFHQRKTRALIPAQIVTRSISGWWQSVGLGKGSRSGIRPAQAVISPDGLVGRTADVSSWTTEVLLVSDPACNVSARISRTGAFGLVTGRGVNLKGYPVARMQFIHKDTPVRVGDEVVTSGLGGVFPRDILIGSVEEVSLAEGGLYQVADILPQAVINLTDVVFVMDAKDISRRPVTPKPDEGGNNVKPEGVE